MVIMDFNVTGRFDSSVERVVAGQIEPEFDIIFNVVLTVFLADCFFDVKGGFGSFGIEFGDKGSSMAEIVSVNGVGLFREISPRFDFD